MLRQSYTAIYAIHSDPYRNSIEKTYDVLTKSIGTPSVLRSSVVLLLLFSSFLFSVHDCIGDQIGIPCRNSAKAI